jgi:hypothetical protein
METLKRFSEHSLNNSSTRKIIDAAGTKFIIESVRGQWKTHAISGKSTVLLSTYSSKATLFENLSRDIVRFMQPPSIALYENDSPDWIKDVLEKILSSPIVLEYGVIVEAVTHEYGMTINFKNFTYSELLDDLGLDQTMESDLELEIVFNSFEGEEKDLIELGLQELPTSYSISITADLQSSHSSISEFYSQRSDSWYQFFDQDKGESLPEPAISLENILATQVSDWVNFSTKTSLKKLEAIASKRR